MVVAHAQSVPASHSHPLGAPIKVCNYTPSGFRGQCPLRGLWLLTCHITNIILIFRAADGIIWTWWLWNGRPSRRWAWLLFVLWHLWCVIFILVAVRLHYDFSYFISRQHTSPFRTRNIATLHFQQKFSTANASNNKISTGRSWTSASWVVV